jgi:outer membrane protein insertion porin family
MRFRCVCLNRQEIHTPFAHWRLPLIVVAAMSLATIQPPQLQGQVLRSQRGAVSGNKLPEGPIVDIQIEGNSTVDTEEVLRKLSSRVGRPLERKTIEKDIRALLDSNWFSDVQPFYDQSEDGKGYVLIFKVREMQKIARVEYRGASAIKVRKLEEATGIKPGSRTDGIKARLGIAAIERLYQEKGYQKVVVNLVSGDKPGDTAVVYEIFEGPKYTISHVEILGNSYVSDGVLKTKIQSKPSILGLLGGSFSKELIEDDARKLREYYQGQGFFEIAVSVVDEPGENLGHRKVSFVISEGPQYKVRNIRFEGNDKIPIESLHDGLALHSNQPFRDDYRDADKKKLLTKYGEIGCIDAKIDVEPKFTNEPGIVDLVYKIEEGDQYLLGEIIVKGNDRSKDKIIRREAEMAGLVPGEPLNANLLQTFQKRLEGTQYFVASPEMGKPINVNIINRRAHDKPYGEGVIPVSLPSGEVTRLQDPGSELPSSAGTVPLGAPNEKPIQIAQAPPSGGAATPAPLLDGTALPPVVEGGNAIGGSPIDGNAIVVPPPSIITIPGNAGTVPNVPGASSTVVPEAIPGAAPLGAGEPPGRFPDLPGLNMSDVGPDRQEPFANRSFADISTQVEEAPTGRFMFGLGASSFGGLSGNFIVHERNFDIFNIPRSWRDVTSGQAFRGGGQEFRFEASPGTVINRMLVSFRDPYLFDLPVALNLSGYVFGRSYPNWYESRGGGRFSLGRQFGTSTYADLAMRVENVNFSGFSMPAPSDYLAASGQTFLASLRPSITFDNRNDPIAPNKGQYVQFAFEQGWGDFTFPKVEIEGRKYFTLHSRPDGSGKHTLTIRSFFGITGRDTPVYERFFAGDFRSMRGFAYRGVGPYVFNQNMGGILSTVGSVEYQFPWTANDKFGQVIFCDFGTVEKDYTFTTFRASVGTGLRVVIPQFGPYPLAFDLAFPVAKGPDDVTRYFTFFIGAFW